MASVTPQTYHQCNQKATAQEMCRVRFGHTLGPGKCKGFAVINSAQQLCITRTIAFSSCGIKEAIKGRCREAIVSVCCTTFMMTFSAVLSMSFKIKVRHTLVRPILSV